MLNIFLADLIANSKNINIQYFPTKFLLQFVLGFKKAVAESLIKQFLFSFLWLKIIRN